MDVEEKTVVEDKLKKTDGEVVLHVGADQLGDIEKARLEKEERDLRNRKAILDDLQHVVLNETGKSETSQLTEMTRASQLEKERKENVEALEKQFEEEKLRKEKDAQEDGGGEVGPVVKGISFIFLLVATVLGGIVSIGMVLAEFYIVYHFDLCTACYVLIVLQILLIVIGTIARWISWYIKVKTGKLVDD